MQCQAGSKFENFPRHFEHNFLFTSCVPTMTELANYEPNNYKKFTLECSDISSRNWNEQFKSQIVSLLGDWMITLGCPCAGGRLAIGRLRMPYLLIAESGHGYNLRAWVTLALYKSRGF